jgi:hypothetical protein
MGAAELSARHAELLQEQAPHVGDRHQALIARRANAMAGVVVDAKSGAGERPAKLVAAGYSLAEIRTVNASWPSRYE